MSDSTYLEFVNRISIEACDSLMISESHRLRSFTSPWVNPNDVVTKNALAKSGFYYTGKF